MGLGAMLRNLQYDVTDTATGESETFTIVTDGGPGAFADWSRGEYQGAMSIPAAWRASLLISDQIGLVPWQAYRDGPGDVAEQVHPTPALLLQPSPPDTAMTSFSSMALDLIYHGNAIMLKVARDASGYPQAAVPVPVRAVNVRRSKGRPELGLRPGDVEYDVGGSIFGSNDVVHVKGPCEPGALRGMGVLEAHLRGTLSLAAELDQQAGSVGAAGVPTGVLKVSSPDLTKAEADALKAGWMAAQRTRTVGVLNAVTDFLPLAWNPTETQLIEARQFSVQQLALVFGIDATWLGATSSSRVYANIEQEGLNLFRYASLAGHLARFEQALSAAMPPGEWARANLDARLRPDTLTRYQAHEIAIRAGFMTDDEVRSLEDRPALTPAQRAQMAPPEPAPVVGGEA
jgi:HK97 family phage portal protein